MPLVTSFDQLNKREHPDGSDYHAAAESANPQPTGFLFACEVGNRSDKKYTYSDNIY